LLFLFAGDIFWICFLYGFMLKKTPKNISKNIKKHEKKC